MLPYPKSEKPLLSFLGQASHLPRCCSQIAQASRWQFLNNPQPLHLPWNRCKNAPLYCVPSGLRCLFTATPCSYRSLNAVHVYFCIHLFLVMGSGLGTIPIEWGLRSSLQQSWAWKRLTRVALLQAFHQGARDIFVTVAWNVHQIKIFGSIYHFISDVFLFISVFSKQQQRGNYSLLYFFPLNWSMTSLFIAGFQCLSLFHFFITSRHGVTLNINFPTTVRLMDFTAIKSPWS